MLWVFSTVLLQMEVPDRFRGRVFSVELALVTLFSSISSYWTGHQLDTGWSPRTMAFALGAMFCIPGTLWFIIESRWKEADVVAVPASGRHGARGRAGRPAAVGLVQLKVRQNSARSAGVCT